MGIDIEAKLIYGLPYADLPEEVLDEVNEMLDDGEIEYASPYYDSPMDEWIIGVDVNCEGTTPWDLRDAIEDAWKEFPELFHEHSLELKLYVSAHVS